MSPRSKSSPTSNSGANIVYTTAPPASTYAPSSVGTAYGSYANGYYTTSAPNTTVAALSQQPQAAYYYAHAQPPQPQMYSMQHVVYDHPSYEQQPQHQQEQPRYYQP